MKYLFEEHLFWAITEYINKKFCNNMLNIDNIKLFKKEDLDKSFPKTKGWYLHDNKKVILISKREDLNMKIRILAHELTHAYQRQILGIKGKMRHDKKGGVINQRFTKGAINFYKKSELN